MTSFKKYYLYTVIGVLIASFYPLYMGVKVAVDLIRDGTVMAENYPKYIIPYTPISLAVIISVLLIPVIFKYIRRFALHAATAVSLVVFFASELLLENMVIVRDNITAAFEDWQMFMCYVPPDNYETRPWKAVDVLIGEYSPAFKLHFYIISVVLIIALLNCFYGFARIIITSDKGRMKALVIQSVSTALFLGLCIFACFTAFFRDGEIYVSTLSGMLMSIYFIVFGVTAGVYAGSFLLGRRKSISILIPSLVASGITLVMYIGEMILLSGNLYRFGYGFIFTGLNGIVLAPVDIFIIFISGCINAVLCYVFSKPERVIAQR